MIKTLRSDKNPRLLVITPLRVGDKVSKTTKKTIKRNKTPMLWVSFEGNGNVAKNTQLCFDIMKSTPNLELPEYLIKIDNDIDASRGMLDKMVETLDRSDDGIGYTYCAFKYTGAVNVSFDAREFDVKRLLESNYISSNSMMKVSVLEEVRGFVTDDRYKRLLDWAMWLRCLQNGYFGKPTPKASFIAISTPDSVSAQSNDDYIIKHRRVHEDFVRQIIKGV